MSAYLETGLISPAEYMALLSASGLERKDVCIEFGKDGSLLSLAPAEGQGFAGKSMNYVATALYACGKLKGEDFGGILFAGR